MSNKITDLFAKNIKKDRSQRTEEAKNKMREVLEALELLDSLLHLVGNPKPEKLPHIFSIAIPEVRSLNFRDIEMWYDTDSGEVVYFSCEGLENV